MKLILASQSATRRKMLEAAGVPFEVRTASFDEESLKAKLRAQSLGAEELAARLAEAKALHVSGNGALVLGADQILELDDGSMLDKPGSRTELAAQLHSLAGRTHRLHSAAMLVEAGTPVWSFVESATLTMRPLSDAFIGAYLESEYDVVRFNVGGYRIEGPGVQLFERIEGNHFAIMGLPLLPLLDYLRLRGVIAR